MTMRPFPFMLCGLLLPLLFSACRKKDPLPKNESLHFPENDTWETTSVQELGWAEAVVPELEAFLEANETRGFLLLKNGRIVLERYWGLNLSGTADFGAQSYWYWASAGKTLTAFTVGLAQEQNFLDTDDAVTNYLGAGWTSATPSQEAAITVWHQLTMTSGLDDGVANNHSTAPADLQYKAVAGTRWAYHNGPYTLLHDVVAAACGQSFQEFFEENLAEPIGLTGFWIFGEDHVYYSTARDMARFGLLMLNDGKWDETPVMTDATFFQDMTKTSQPLNEAYGYLWWLNGRSTFMIPEVRIVLQGSIAPNAPEDMVAAMGKNGQLLNVVPSQGLIVVRMGDNPDQSGVPVLFQNELWGILSRLIP